MTSARTIRYWSYYVAVVGLSLSITPGFTFDLLGLELEGEVWIRVLGVVLLLLASYYYAMAASNARMVIVSTLVGRSFSALALALIWLTGGPWQLVLFAAVDVLGTVWTLRALQSE